MKRRALYAAPIVLTATFASGAPTHAPPEAKIKSRVVWRDDGRCFEFDAPKCKPDEKCAPPPSYEVSCPPPMSQASDRSNVHVSADGACREHDLPSCPPGVFCNPGPPREVTCPDLPPPPPKGKPAKK